MPGYMTAIVDPVLTNPRSDRVKAVRSLSGRSARQKYGCFLAEGPQAVREAVRFQTMPVRDLYLTGQASERYPEIVEAAQLAEIRIHLCSEEVSQAMSPDSQGVLAVVHQTAVTVKEVLARDPRTLVILHEVRDPGNAGTIIRSADAAGAAGVILTGQSVEVYNPKVVRATAGSLFHLPVVSVSGLSEVTGLLDLVGFTTLATAASGEHSLDELQDAVVRAKLQPQSILGPDEVDLRRRTAWIFGNEAHGLADADLNLAQHTVRIDIPGAAESLNLATAAALCIFASARAQRGVR